MNFCFQYNLTHGFFAQVKMSLLLLSGNWKHSGEVKSSVNGNVYPTAQRRYATFFKHVLTSYCWPLTALYALYRKTYYYCCYPCWQVQLFLAPFPHRTCLVEKSTTWSSITALSSFPSDKWAFFFFFFCPDKCSGNSVTSSFTFPIAQTPLDCIFHIQHSGWHHQFLLFL